MTLRRSLATLSAVTLVAGSTALLTAAPASAVEREGRCDGAKYQLEVEREDGGRFDVDADIENAPAGSQWRVVLTQNGTTIANVVRRADSEGDVSVDRDNRPNRPGNDTFTLRVNKVGTTGGCTHTIVMRG